MSSVFDYINSINNKKYIWDDLTSPKEFDVYIVNLAFSYYIDTILFANIVNMHSNTMTKKQVYDFYYYSISKRKRWSKWNKIDKKTKELIEKIAEFYNMNYNETKNALKILKKEDVVSIYKYITDLGGK